MLTFLRGHEALIDSNSNASADFDTIVSGATRLNVARAFYQVLVLASTEYVVVEQGLPMGGIQIVPGAYF
jgi:Conserved region of Rad21 / Rec8 like protein